MVNPKELEEERIQADPERVMIRSAIYKPRLVTWAEKEPAPAEVKPINVGEQYYRIRTVPTRRHLANFWGDYHNADHAMEQAEDLIQNGKARKVELYTIEGDFEHRVGLCSKRIRLSWKGIYYKIDWDECF